MHLHRNPQALPGWGWLEIDGEAILGEADAAEGLDILLKDSRHPGRDCRRVEPPQPRHDLAPVDLAPHDGLRPHVNDAGYTPAGHNEPGSKSSWSINPRLAVHGLDQAGRQNVPPEIHPLGVLAVEVPDPVMLPCQAEFHRRQRSVKNIHVST